MNTNFKKFIKNTIPAPVIRTFYPLSLKAKAARFGMSLKVNSAFIDVIKGTDVVRISADHSIYLNDAISEFDFFFSGVVPIKIGDRNIADFSTPRYHDVVGFERYPIMFPAFAEPVATTHQYLKFAGLAEGMTVLDLGAYSGLTSIIFAQAVGKSGLVVAVEADMSSIQSIRTNLANFKRYCGTPIFLLEAAVWEHNNGLVFSSEGNMGASAASIVGGNRGKVTQIPSYTLSSIADKYQLGRVDFIKCDIEGAEKVIFTDQAFFKRFLPRIIIETHIIDEVETTDSCVRALSAVGYDCKRVMQEGYSLPLLECSPASKRVSKK